ncbi:MAG TPA: Hsp20/alpha crystallin family protein [Candidatus Polarisedimenticolia bacterium]|nr:Hsp20/alpha crystallin family protein [Candidatus Polarisedimenticolia bacterium]
MTITRWDPFRDLMTIQERMNRLFQETLSRQHGQENIETGQWAPPVDIYESGDTISLRADLPGVEQSEIEIRVDDNTLTIRGERKMPADLRPDNVHRSERPYGPFFRSFSLPSNLDQAAIRASQKNGVLEISLPKKQEAKAKAIRIDVK